MSLNENIVSSNSAVEANAYFYNDLYEKKQWYLDGSTQSLLNIDVYSVWKDYTGTGIKVGVIDSQIDFRHQDLARAYDTSLDYNFATNTANVTLDPKNLPFYHGTGVAGVISAQSGNGIGTAGIASGAKLVGYGIDYNSSNVADQITSALRMSKVVDVVNNSWSFSGNFEDNFAAKPAYESALIEAVSKGRGGLGTSVVFAAGNAGSAGSSNYHNFQNSPYSIAVGAVNADGSASSFTSLGSNVLISAAGRDVFTTVLNDRYDNTAGTSFAAPAVSAAISLMLQANPDLGYRDVQKILAYSAQREGLATGANFGDGWRTNGAETFNGGGLHYSDAFGYGFLNVHDAVRLAETWSSQNTYDNMVKVTQTVSAHGQLVAGSSDHISVDIPLGQAIDIEHVQLSMDLRWVQTGDLDVYLVSPDGTQVRLVYDLPSEDKAGNIRNFTFSSVASMGEQSAGTWTLEVYNRNPAAVDKDGKPLTGSLDGVTLTVSGSSASSDDTYVYTDEFGTLYAGADLSARSVLKDTNGGKDTINAAAVTSNSVIDLSGGVKTVIAGVTLAVQANTIENAYAGDGKDTLIGSSANNLLSGGRGDDTLYFSFGNDKLDGGQGSDKLILDYGFGSLSGYVTTAGEIAISAKAGEVSTVSNVETFVFKDITYSVSQLLSVLDAKGPAHLPGDVATPTPEQETPSTGDGGSTGGSGGDQAGSHASGTFDETARSYDRNLIGTVRDDNLKGTEKADFIDGLDGHDDLTGRNGDDALYGHNGHDRLAGGAGADYLEGGTGNDKLSGDDGNDKLVGGVGDDILKGGAGDDWIIGGTGADKLYGGEGADTFVFDINELDAVDVIYDFDARDGDQIVINGLSASGAASFEIETRGANSYLEMHMDGKSYDIARIKGDGLDTLTMASFDDHLIWA